MIMIIFTDNNNKNDDDNDNDNDNNIKYRVCQQQAADRVNIAAVQEKRKST